MWSTKEAELNALLRKPEFRHIKSPVYRNHHLNHCHYVVSCDLDVFDLNTTTGREAISIMIGPYKYPFVEVDMSIRDYWKICDKIHIKYARDCLSTYRIDATPDELCLFTRANTIDVLNYATLLMLNDCTDFGVIVEHIIAYVTYKGATANRTYEIIKYVCDHMNDYKDMSDGVIFDAHIRCYAEFHPKIGRLIFDLPYQAPTGIGATYVATCSTYPRLLRAIDTQNREYEALTRERALCANIVWYCRVVIHIGHRRATIMYICVYALLRAHKYSDSEIWAILHDSPVTSPAICLGSVISRRRRFGIE